jgi:serine/threonine protein kinase
MDIGLEVSKHGVTLPGCKSQLGRLIERNERKMTIYELRRHRHEVSLFLSLRLFKIPFLMEMVSLVCSFLPFESEKKDYEITDTLRSERGLEKADGNLYELHEAVHIETDTEVVMEVFHIEEKGVLPTFLQRELKMSSVLHKHANIWQIIDEIRMDDRIMIIRHRVECTLSTIITQRGALDIETIKNYMHQLLTFIHDCHSHNVICDGISSGSIYIDENNVLKITRNPANFYDPPERLMADSEERRAQVSSEKKDVWSLGCVFAKLGKGGWLFNFERSDVQDLDVLHKIFKTLGTPERQDCPDTPELHDYFASYPPFRRQCIPELVPRLNRRGIHLLERMLCFDPEERISAEEALRHPFFL